jgi:hypothetical protein
MRIASARTVRVSSSSRGWSTKRSRVGALAGITSMSQACNDEERAPVSTLALVDATPSLGSDTHSRQPITAGEDAEAAASSPWKLAVETVMLL